PGPDPQPEPLSDLAHRLGAEGVAAEPRDAPVHLLEAQHLLERLAAVPGREAEQDRLAVELAPLEARARVLELRRPLRVTEHGGVEPARLARKVVAPELDAAAHVLDLAAFEHERDQAGDVGRGVEREEAVDEREGGARPARGGAALG